MAKAAKKAATSRGGKRAGSGRPSVLVNPVNKLIRLEKSMVEKIDAKGVEISTFLREAGARRLEEGW